MCHHLFSFGSLVVILSTLPSRIGTGNTGHMFTYLLSQKYWKTGRTLSILVSPSCLLASTGSMQTKRQRGVPLGAAVLGRVVEKSCSTVSSACLGKKLGSNFCLQSVAQEKSLQLYSCLYSSFGFNSCTVRS